jgi:hypothetical protein
MDYFRNCGEKAVSPASAAFATALHDAPGY